MPFVAKSTGPITEYEYTRLMQYGTSSCVASGGVSEIAGNGSDRPRTYFHSYMNGWTTPNWRKLRNLGVILPMTPWKQFQIETVVRPAQREYCESASGKRRYWENLYRTYSTWHPFADASTLMSFFSEPDLEYYVQKAAASINNSGWDALTFLAEIRQLRNMLNGIGGKLDSLLRGQSPGELHNLWLEGRYGWRTLMYDIRDLHELLTAVKEKRTRYRQQSGHTSVESWQQEQTAGPTNSLYTLVTEQITRTLNIRAVVVADIDVPDLQFNPVLTAWEVTRLSFVVDWLLNVGQALSAASFLLKVKSYAACGGFRADFSMEGNYANAGTTGTATSFYENGGYDATAHYEERIPMQVSSIPRIKLRLDEWKIIDLLSLIRQRI